VFIDYHSLDIGQDRPPQTPEILYQSDPYPDNSYYTVPHRPSWTSSRATYQNAARKEYHLLLNNYREANHEIVIGYLREYFIQELLDQFAIIKEHLTSEGIIAYYVAEVTTDDFNNPVNQIHYHFLIEYHGFTHRLKRIFKCACRLAGLQLGRDCRVLYDPIPDGEVYEHKCRYVLKYKTFKKQAILFQPGTGINKVGMVNHFFINPDGTRASKEDLWQSIVSSWYPNPITEQQQSMRVSIRVSVSLQG